MKKRGWITVIILLLIWLYLGKAVNNEIRLPALMDVMDTMIMQASSPEFYQAFWMTIQRSLSGLIIAGIAGLILGVLSGLSPKFEEYFSPIYLILKSIPNVSYILIVLIWTSNDFAVKTISFMIIFPMTYANVLSGMKSIDQDLLDVMELYPESKFTEIIHVYLPLISPYVLAALNNGLGLAFKVGIMAEIIGSVSPGVGRMFQVYRINVDMTSTFALTIWVVLFLGLVELIIRLIRRQLEKYHVSAL